MSNELTVPNMNLPDTISDLSKFILVGREKLTAVKAEIRAINKLKLAEDVHKQKQEEAVMLAEALLDAEVKMGELLKKVPKGSGGNRGNQHTGGKIDSGVDFGKNDGTTKKEVIEDIGLNQKQAERLEILADNQDIVEQVKAEARENDDIPTRTRVLELASKKKKVGDDYGEYLNLHMKVCKELDKIIDNINKFEITDYRMDALFENFSGVSKSGDTIKYIETAKEKLAEIVTELRKAEKRAKQ
jgi:hypothetical protein